MTQKTRAEKLADAERELAEVRNQRKQHPLDRQLIKDEKDLKWKIRRMKGNDVGRGIPSP